MHWQAEPHFETKLVHCQRGRIFDVVVDVRPESETFGRWCGFELAGDNSEMLLVPGGLAHGYLTLEKGSEILYQIAGDYKTNMQKSLNWDDPTIKIEWPERPLLISTRDSKAPFWTDLFA
jgi:dTDP-4-dehydrorhamnose 3,5-epimerase